jgi:formate hydrogenlyase transcriptional activator
VLRINNLLANQLEPQKLFEAVSSALFEQTHHYYLSVSVLEEDGQVECVRFIDVPSEEGRGRQHVNFRMPVRSAPIWTAIRTGRTDFLGPERLAAVESVEARNRLAREGIRSICCLPLIAHGRPLGCLSLGSRDEGPIQDEIIRLLEQVAIQVAIALDNSLAYQEIRLLRDKLAEEKLYLEEEVRRDFATDQIIGNSPALRRVMYQMATVAPSDATVLLLGETGTGKELLARAIHEHSQRRARTFVKLNCSAIPMGLLESELFGHERGAFTGAIQQKVGRFELAHQGTLFLDEVGDLPLELQPKLLRAIQEREFERLGSNRTIHVDVRLIAATHRDLAVMVAEGAFRDDLFYRFNVFPIRVPPMRERKEDIPSLVRHFTQKFALAMGRRIERIPTTTMEALVNWPWPGNIRELQNLVERSVILSPGAELRVPLAELNRVPEPGDAGPAKSLEDVERRHILQVLEQSRWVLSGSSGAAARLGIKRTTLINRLKKLGITRPAR